MFFQDLVVLKFRYHLFFNFLVTNFKKTTGESLLIKFYCLGCELHLLIFITIL